MSKKTHLAPALGTEHVNVTDGITTHNKGKWIGLMRPRGRALEHPAAPLLLQYAQQGCPVDCGPNWTPEQIQIAVERGPHPSARHDEAAKELWKEAHEKVEQGFAKIVAWKDIKDNPPATLKVSPIAMIPHKSRQFRAILDLSFRLKIAGVRCPSVNDATSKMAPQEAMNQLGSVLPRLFDAMAHADSNNGPLLFAKLDIKDGFWRMVVPPQDEWNFAYVLPKRNDDENSFLVVPSALQMGWSESPPFFCSASETARDIAADIAENTEVTLPPHPQEEWMLPHQWEEEEVVCTNCNLLSMIEVYVDDFIAMAQCRDKDKLRHISRSLLHAIHEVFPPPSITGHNGEDPISLKKLKAGDGTWSTTKEILGWIFNGKSRCIELKLERTIAITEE